MVDFIYKNFVKNILPLRDLQAVSGLRNGGRFKKKWNFGDKNGKHPGCKFLFFCFDKFNQDLLYQIKSKTVPENVQIGRNTFPRKPLIFAKMQIKNDSENSSNLPVSMHWEPEQTRVILFETRFGTETRVLKKFGFLSTPTFW